MNRMYKQFGQQNGMNNMVNQIKDFQKSFKGDPQQQLNSLLNSGKIPQNALNQAQQMAKPIYELMKGLK